MRFIIPQQALVQAAPTQFGRQAVMGISAGLGFRLSDPRVLLHSASSWAAFMAAPMSVRFMELALPKRHAEWLLAGHAAHPIAGHPHVHGIDWTAAVSVGETRKVVSCYALPPAGATEGGVVRLAVDHAQALKTPDNPLGTETHPPLQLMSAVGPKAHPLAGMGPVDPAWPSRRRWMPRGDGRLHPLGHDGSHMGWPGHTDWRGFQLAPEQQWCPDVQWPADARYELAGFGARGEHLAGSLPPVRPEMAVQRRGLARLEAVSPRLQTLWLLPDADLGIMWWNALVPIDGVFSDELEALVVAFREPSQLLGERRLEEIVAQRSAFDLESTDGRRDSQLLPDADRGWAWDFILGVEQHPRASRSRPSYDTLRRRMVKHEADIDAAMQGAQKTKALKSALNERPWEALPDFQPQARPATDWRSRLKSLRQGDVLSDCTIEDADLSGIQLTGVVLRKVHLKRCDLRRSEWVSCRLEDVHFVACHLQESAWRDCHLSLHGCTASDLSRSSWHGCHQAQGRWTECRADGCVMRGGSLSDITLESIQSVQAGFHEMNWQNCNIAVSTWHHLRIESINCDGLSFVESDLSNLRAGQCVLSKLSGVSTDLSSSQWHGCQSESWTLARGSRLTHAEFIDCQLASVSWIDLDAERLIVKFSELKDLMANRLRAPGSTWEKTVLAQAKLLHADLTSARFLACSLKEAVLCGADLRASSFEHCNLIHMQSSWAWRGAADRWKRNLSAGECTTPRRVS